MIHFALFAGTHDSYAFVGVFSSQELADAAKIEAVKIKGYAHVQAIRIDQYATLKAVRHWMATINIVSGELLKDESTGPRFNEPVEYEWEDDTWMEPDDFKRSIQDVPYEKSGYVPKEIHVWSRVSQEAARELAVAARKALLERIDVTRLKEETPGAGHYYPRD